MSNTDKIILFSSIVLFAFLLSGCAHPLHDCRPYLFTTPLNCSK